MEHGDLDDANGTGGIRTPERKKRKREKKKHALQLTPAAFGLIAQLSPARRRAMRARYLSLIETLDWNTTKLRRQYEQHIAALDSGGIASADTPSEGSVSVDEVLKLVGKRRMVEALLERGPVLVEVDAQASDVLVPASF